jgi:hypothetical protein
MAETVAHTDYQRLHHMLSERVRVFLRPPGSARGWLILLA